MLIDASALNTTPSVSFFILTLPLIVLFTLLQLGDKDFICLHSVSANRV